MITEEQINEAIMRQALRNIKRECSEGICESCTFKKHNEEGMPYCEITGLCPADWKI